LVLGILSGFVLTAAVTNIIPLKNIIGSILGSLISAGVALFVFYKQSEKQRLKSEQEEKAKSMERENKRKIVSKRVHFIKKEIRQELLHMQHESSVNYAPQMAELIYKDIIEAIDGYINELKEYSNLIGVNELNSYFDFLGALYKWKRSISESVATDYNEGIYKDTTETLEILASIK
jgi:hypothetical protein